MYAIDRRVLFCALLIVAPSWVHSKLIFNVKFWNVCLSNKSGLRKIAGISLEECIVECDRRSSCENIVYQRHVAICQLFGNFDSAIFFPNRRDCIVISRDEIDTSMFTGQCVCDEGQVCNKGRCEHEECTPPAVSNGGFIGNMYAVGSSLGIICEKNYTEINNQTSIECESSGFWSYYPTCVSTKVCGDMRFANGELIGTGKTVGAKRTVACHTGFEEELGEIEVLCESSGSWNYTPVCKIICPSDSGHSRSNFRLKVFHAGSDQKKHNEAYSNCAADGGILVKINETWKMDFVKEILTTCSTYSKHDYWTDGKEYNGAWFFSDNTSVPMTSQFWHDGQPDKSEYCARIKNTNDVYLWDDSKCKDKFRFICEY